MKILCVIDSLGSGGAQRQIVNLACGLKEKGYDVELLTYNPGANFFLPILDQSKIKVYTVKKGYGFSFKVLFYFASLLRRKKFHSVISYQESSNVYSVLAKVLTLSSVRLLVAERSSKEADRGLVRTFFIRLSYLLANSVIVNSYNHADYLSRYAWIRNKLKVIYNGYDVSSVTYLTQRSNETELKLLAIGRINSKKNFVRLAEALFLFQEKNGYMPNLAWAGRQEQDSSSMFDRSHMDNLSKRNPILAEKWQWLGERNDIPQLLAECDALIHVSLFEGLPNVVCEAFIAGRPVIASAVCDHPKLIEDGVRGVLCDPLSPESICAAIERFVEMSEAQRLMLSKNAREYAQQYLTINRMIVDYESLLGGNSVS